MTWDGKDVLPDLAAIDDRYYPMPTNLDRAELRFPAPLRKAAMNRTVFLHSRGWYQLYLRDGGAPDYATLTKITFVPGAPVQFAIDRFAEWRQGAIH
jgi:hypothetical protein